MSCRTESRALNSCCSKCEPSMTLADSADALRTLGDRLRERLGSAVVVLGAVTGDRPSFLALVTDDVVARGMRADALVRTAAAVAGGGGGGRPQLAQAGGKDASKLDAALEAARAAAREQLARG